MMPSLATIFLVLQSAPVVMSAGLPADDETSETLLVRRASSTSPSGGAGPLDLSLTASGVILMAVFNSLHAISTVKEFFPPTSGSPPSDTSRWRDISHEPET